MRVIKFELIRLYEIQNDLRRLSYFNLTGRLRLTIRLARVAIEIPMVRLMSSNQFIVWVVYAHFF
jgi:hypothetical protein